VAKLTLGKDGGFTYLVDAIALTALFARIAD